LSFQRLKLNNSRKSSQTQQHDETDPDFGRHSSGRSRLLGPP